MIPSRQQAVDMARVREVSGISDKRTDVGAKRYVRSIGVHFVLRPACCCCKSPVGKPGGVCLYCTGAVLVGEEHQ